jgi:hypothetical protein
VQWHACRDIAAPVAEPAPERLELLVLSRNPCFRSLRLKRSGRSVAASLAQVLARLTRLTTLYMADTGMRTCHLQQALFELACNAYLCLLCPPAS